MKSSLLQISIALLKRYANRPSLFLKHATKAGSILVSNGVDQFIFDVRQKISSINEDIVRNEVRYELVKRFSCLKRANERNANLILRELGPFLDDLQILDVVHDDNLRLRLATRHLLKKHYLFDEKYYKNQYLDDVDSIQPADHYFKYGVYSGLRPNAYFDPEYYIRENPDVVAFGMEPILHFALFGWRDGRSGGGRFDTKYYLASNPDVAKAGVSPFIHFMETGRFAGRKPISNCPSGKRDDLISHAPKQGTILVVSHDAELGGAQQVVRVLATWLNGTTWFDVRLVTMRSGPFVSMFSDIGPTFVVSDHPAGEVEEKLEEFAGSNVRAVFLNSVASGQFLRHWQRETPIVAYIHELNKLLTRYKSNLELIKQRAGTIIAGAGAVREALQIEFGVAPEKLETVRGFIEADFAGKLVDIESKRAAKQRIGVQPDTILITACGVLHWRKSPEKFIEVAKRVVARTSKKVLFMWIGGGPDQAKCEKLVDRLGLAGKVTFTDYERDITRPLSASDIFLLPSEEDPFPLVCLYAAAALNPVICFKEAGGMPEFVSKGCGKAVPFGDVDAMADAVCEYLENEAARLRDALKGREVVASEHTISSAGPALLHHIRTAAGLKPHISVIVPNYNYSRFLAERLKTISDQSYQNFEIVLLDDKSSDDSATILKSFADSRPGTRLLLNSKNSGSPFAQWIKGMRAATGDIVWIAEADDFCERGFLETVLPAFDDRNVFLGYCKSVPVDEAGKPLGDYETLYLNRIAEGRWSRPYVVTDHQEANQGLGIANCIPNASSVVFRAFDPEPEFEKTVTSMKMCGDWLFYLRAMRGGSVAYRHEPFNYHRRHSGTVTSRTEGSARYFDEFTEIRRYVDSNYHLEQPARDQIERFLVQDIERFKITGDERKNAICGASRSAHTGGKALPTVLVVVSDLSPGGGQMFGIRLANTWMRRGGRVVLLNAAKFPDHPKVVSKIDPRVTLINAADIQEDLSELIERYDIDVVHSSIWWADKLVYRNIGALPGLPWVVTMHGCHDTILEHPEVDGEFGEVFAGMLKRVNCWVPTARKNWRVFDKYGAPLRYETIVNGVEVEPGRSYSRAELGLRKDALVLILASRAIAEKGWFEAVEAVKRLNREGVKTDLMLIGEGPAADEIKRKAPAHVHLYGQVNNLQDYIETADIGLLPSRFVGESMPLVILEFMACGKPVVATDAGEIGALIGTGKDAAGMVIPLQKGNVDVKGFVGSIGSLADLRLRKRLGARARNRFDERYTMDRMVSSYLILYAELVSNQKSAFDRA